MAEDLGSLRIATVRGEIVISADAAEQLKQRIRQVAGTEAVISVFQAAGSTRAVELSKDQKHVLLATLDFWIADENDVLPDGLPNLWAVLGAEQRDEFDLPGFWEVGAA